MNIGWTDTPGEDTQKKFHEGEKIGLQKQSKSLKRLTKPIDAARAAAICSEESAFLQAVSRFDQTVVGWHSYSAYETKILDDSLLGE